MKILVIIVTYNAMQWAEHCFNSLRKSTVRPDVFVVDNGSTDGTQKYIQEHYPEVMFQQSETNLGFGKANNLGLQYALDNDYDYVYLLNQDAWVMEDTFEKLIEISQENPEYGILSPFQMNADLYHVDSNFMKRSCSQSANPNILNDALNAHLQQLYQVPFVMAAHWLISKRCLHIVGGFSPSFPHYGEDNNYVQRAYFYNFKIGVVPGVRVVHDRADRVISKEKVMYLDYITCIIGISNPNLSPLKSIFRISCRCFKKTIKLRSFVPLIYWIKILFKLNCYFNNRLISMKKICAFIGG